MTIHTASSNGSKFVPGGNGETEVLIIPVASRVKRNYNN